MAASKGTLSCSQAVGPGRAGLCDGAAWAATATPREVGGDGVRTLHLACAPPTGPSDGPHTGWGGRPRTDKAVSHVGQGEKTKTQF